MNKLLTAEELAPLLNIGPAQVRKLTRENEIPYHRIGGAIRYDYEAVKSATEMNGNVERKLIPAPATLKGLLVDDERSEFSLVDLVWCTVHIHDDDVDLAFISANGTLWNEAVDTSTDRVISPHIPHVAFTTLGDWAKGRNLKARML